MKTSNIVLAIIAGLGLLSQSCTKEYNRIEGMGSISTETLNIEEFTDIRLEGADDVDITYGPVQKVEVTGHPNIISRIKTDVRSGTWDMGLEDGNYGRYELKYSLTLPELTGVQITGSSNIKILDSITTESFELVLFGSGNFDGFKLNSKDSFVEIIGSGNCEITTSEKLEVVIEGSGNVFYKGQPRIQTDITGSGSIVDAN